MKASVKEINQRIDDQQRLAELIDPDNGTAIKKTLGGLLTLVFLAACSSIKVVEQHWNKEADVPGQRATQSTRPIIVVGDTQEHWLLGLPHAQLGGSVDRVAARVTIRPATHALFGRQVFRHLLGEVLPKQSQSSSSTTREAANATQVSIADDVAYIPPVLHLGDLLDHSCHAELDPYKILFDQFDQQGRGWAFTIGNHDGLFNGVINPSEYPERLLMSRMGWQFVCSRPAQYTRTACTYPRDSDVFGCYDVIVAARGLSEETAGKEFKEFKDGTRKKETFERECLGLGNANTRDRLTEIRLQMGECNYEKNSARWPISEEEATFLNTHLSKDELLAYYYGQRGGYIDAPKSRAGFSNGKGVFELQDIELKGAFVEKIGGKITWRKPACPGGGACPIYTKSYLVQLLSLPLQQGGIPFKVLLLDTSNFEKEYGVWSMFGRNPGTQGNLRNEQIKKAKAFIDAAKDSVIIFAGHHPWQNLDKDARRLILTTLFDSVSKKQPLIYLSAHSHNGFWTTHDIGSGQRLYELNVSSLADWPISYRKLAFEAPQDLSWIRVNSPAVPTLSKSWPKKRLYNELIEAWKEKTCKNILPVEVAVTLEEDIKRITAEQQDGRTNLRAYRDIYKDKMNDLRAALKALAALSSTADKSNAHFRWWTQRTNHDGLGFSEVCQKSQPFTAKLKCEAEEIVPKVLSEAKIRERSDRAAGLINQFQLELLEAEKKYLVSSVETAAMACAHVIAAAKDHEGPGTLLEGSNKINKSQFEYEHGYAFRSRDHE